MLVSWNSTNQCNMYCDHCYRDAGVRLEDELSTAEAKKLIGEIKKAGFQIMIFSGGEPLMRPDIFELGAYASQCGLRPVLGTNATLITGEIAEKLKEAGFMAAGISLDSLNEQKHDGFRKYSGALQQAVAGMRNLKAAGVSFQIHTTVMQWNMEELGAIADFAVDIGAMAFHVFFLVPTGRGEQIQGGALSRVEYEKTLHRVMDIASRVPIEVKPTCAPQFMRVAEQKGIRMRFNRGCLAGISYCIISPLGRVQPCAYMDMYIGNVRETAFDRIWQENEVFQILRTQKYQGKCAICEYGASCGGCRARALYFEGDMMAEDSWCLYQPKGGRPLDES